MNVSARIYIARHERHEAIEAYGDHLTLLQKEYLVDNEGDFWLELQHNAPAKLLLIEDEG